MTAYEKPMIIGDMEAFEGVYAESGYEIPPSMTADVTWTNQNSGSHSDLSVDVHTGEQPGEYIRVTLTWNGEGNITGVGGWSGPYTSCDFSGNTITFVRDGHFNPNESFQFGFNNVTFDTCGDPDNRDGDHTGSYYASGSHIGESAPFSLDYECHA